MPIFGSGLGSDLSTSTILVISGSTISVSNVCCPRTLGKRYPICIAGGGDGPPEDCGGPEGYRALVKQQHFWLADFDLRDDVVQAGAFKVSVPRRL